MPRGSSETKVTDPAPKRTPLYDIHVSLGAKMVPFGGYEMPVAYPRGIAAEHRAVRETAGVFDGQKVRDRLARIVDDEDLRRYIL